MCTAHCHLGLGLIPQASGILLLSDITSGDVDQKLQRVLVIIILILVFVVLLLLLSDITSGDVGQKLAMILLIFI